VTGTQSSVYFSSSVSCSVTTAHTQITCTSASGIGSAVSWAVKVGGQTSPVLSGLSSFAAPAISSISSPELDTSGGQSLVVSGSNFGALIAYVMVTYGPSSGTEYTASCTFATAHSSLTCTSAPGIGKLMKFIVTVGDRSNGLYSSTVKYRCPALG
jgi:hypothetical protein